MRGLVDAEDVGDWAIVYITHLWKVLALNDVGEVSITLASAYGLEDKGNTVDVQDAHLQVYE